MDESMWVWFEAGDLVRFTMSEHPFRAHLITAVNVDDNTLSTLTTLADDDVVNVAMSRASFRELQPVKIYETPQELP